MSKQIDFSGREKQVLKYVKGNKTAFRYIVVKVFKKVNKNNRSNVSCLIRRINIKAKKMKLSWRLVVEGQPGPSGKTVRKVNKK